MKTLCVLPLLLLALFLFGCASTGMSPEAAFLLEEDYLTMTDSELITYEQALGDELVRASKASNQDVGVGVGLGSWGSNVGINVHADKWFRGGGGSETTQKLYRRRQDVRQEMRRRGLLQEQGGQL